MLGILHFCLRFEPSGLECQRREIAELAMRSLGIVLLPECAEAEALRPLGLTPAALDAKLESLRITYEQWHTEINPQRQAAVLREVFGGAV